jgi:outer membrane protein assembly factor BamD
MMLSMMSESVSGRVRGTRRLVVLVMLAGALASGCAAKSTKVPPGTNQPDKFLFERGTEQLTKKKWSTAREYFQTLVETYPQSPYRADAKLGVGDTYLGEGTSATQVQALQEFREFLSFFPTHPRADYAQYKLAMAHYYQMAKPERDQSETRHSIEEFDAFFARYPNSALTAEAKKHYREARDRMSDSEYRVGLFYHRARWYPGAIDRFQAILKTDPQFTGRDAIYFYLADALVKMKRPAEALPQLQKLVDEFEQSEYLVQGKKLMAEVKAGGLEAPPAATPAAGAAPAAGTPGAAAPGTTVTPPEIKSTEAPKKVVEPTKPGKPPGPPQR